MRKTLSTRRYVPMKTAQDKGYLRMSPADIWKSEGWPCEVEDPVFFMEPVYMVSGTHYREGCNCDELTIEDAADNRWSNCPYCGEELSEYILKDFQTETEALASKEYRLVESVECRLAVTARSRGYEVKDGLFAIEEDKI